MPRTFAGVACLLAFASFSQAQYDPPPPFPPDAETMKQIMTKQEELKAAFEKLPKDLKADIRADVEIYLKAAEWIVRHGEFYTKDSAKQTLTVLDAGLARTKAAMEGKTPWRDVRNKPITRGYYSMVDGSVQPFSVTIPESYGRGDKTWRLDLVLHGRDSSISEVKYIAGWENAKPAAKENDFILIQAFGRGNNAFRWAGEKDLWECRTAYYIGEFRATENKFLDPSRVVVRGFSMGGAGTWHMGLHHPLRFAAMGPGAGFTNTRAYIKGFPKVLPDYIEKCLHIYDAVDYAENAFNIPVVAYSGENDPQKTAADNIEQALKGFELPLRFTHLVAPGLKHEMPREWQVKAEELFVKYAGQTRAYPDHVRFVTYTTKFGDFGLGRVMALDEHYGKAVIDAKANGGSPMITTTNIAVFDLNQRILQPTTKTVTIDGQVVNVALPPGEKEFSGLGPVFIKENGKTWKLHDQNSWSKLLQASPRKFFNRQGPIDDAFDDPFTVTVPSGEGWYPEVTKFAAADAKRFGYEWDRYFRGALPTTNLIEHSIRHNPNSVLFGDPGSNPEIAKVLEQLPITWTKEKLVMNGVSYEPKTHVPVLIYPRKGLPGYIVLNSGHTFKEADLKGTNALLYPRLGDWAVLKLAPTEKDPNATEVVAAGLFDENWQFPKK